MSEPKPSTADILAKIRAQKTGAGSPAVSEPVAATPAPVTPPAELSTSAAPPAPVAKPKATPAAKPGSTSDILAAIRAGKSGAAAAAPATESSPAKPAPAPAAAAKPAVPVASGAPKPSVEEMLNAVRGKSAGAGAVVPAVVAKPALPPMPVKPPAAKEKKAAAGVDRRSFVAACFAPVVVGFSAMAATSLIWLLDLARFMFPNVLVEPPTAFKIGPPSDYPLGGVSTKWLAARGVWIVHTDQYKGRNLIYALASVCTHLGCTPNWLEGEQKYKCPCHGSGFYVNGINFEGPAPRPLERVGLKLAADGQLEVDKSVKFQEEMGQWEDPNSFVDGSLV
jgi:cytochrome b6-f complex iron-sulfur subunit